MVDWWVHVSLEKVWTLFIVEAMFYQSTNKNGGSYFFPEYSKDTTKTNLLKGFDSHSNIYIQTKVYIRSTIGYFFNFVCLFFSSLRKNILEFNLELCLVQFVLSVAAINICLELKSELSQFSLKHRSINSYLDNITINVYLHTFSDQTHLINISAIFVFRSRKTN